MQEVEGQADFRRVEPSVLLRQPPLSLHMKHEVAAAHELDDEKEPRGRLEAGMEAHQERMVGGRLKNVLFRLNPINILEKRAG